MKTSKSQYNTYLGVFQTSFRNVPIFLPVYWLEVNHSLKSMDSSIFNIALEDPLEFLHSFSLCIKTVTF